MKNKIALRSAMALVVANMIGAGIFTTTGFQAESLGSPALIYFLWILGGVIALCGALCYSELGAAIPSAGASVCRSCVITRWPTRVAGATRRSASAARIAR